MIAEIITERWRMLAENQENLKLFNEKHGKQIIQTLVMHVLDDLGQLDQETLKTCRSKEFYEYLAWNLRCVHSLKGMRSKQLKAFVSQVYHDNEDLFQPILMEILSDERVKQFVSGEYKEAFDKAMKEEQLIKEQSASTTGSSSSNVQNKKQGFFEGENPYKKEDLLVSGSTPQVEESEEVIFWRTCFKQQEDIASEIEDAISEIQNLKNRNALLSFESSVKLNRGNTFIFVYRSQALGISDVCSDPKSRKKEAQHEAAKKFLPHFLYYAKYKSPFFTSLDEQRVYLENKKELNAQKLSSFPSTSCSNNGSNSGSRDSSMERSAKPEYDLRADLEMAEKYQQEVKDVYTKLQRHEEKNGVDALKVDYKAVYAGIFSCTLQFIQQGQVVITTEGRGISKKTSKEVSFMKMDVLLTRFYESKPPIKRLAQFTDRNQQSKGNNNQNKNNNHQNKFLLVERDAFKQNNNGQYYQQSNITNNSSNLLNNGNCKVNPPMQPPKNNNRDRSNQENEFYNNSSNHFSKNQYDNSFFNIYSRSQYINKTNSVLNSNSNPTNTSNSFVNNNKTNNITRNANNFTNIPQQITTNQQKKDNGPMRQPQQQQQQYKQKELLFIEKPRTTDGEEETQQQQTQQQPVQQKRKVLQIKNNNSHNSNNTQNSHSQQQEGRNTKQSNNSPQFNQYFNNYAPLDATPLNLLPNPSLYNTQGNGFNQQDNGYSDSRYANSCNYYPAYVQGQLVYYPVPVPSSQSQQR